MAEGLTIREVAARSGVPAGTLRMWEERYGFPKPQRLPSGHRRFTDEQVEEVRAVVAAREAGLSQLVAYVMEDNSAMRAVFAKAGGHTTYDDPGLVRVAVEPARAAALLDPAIDQDIASAVHDVVTAASLALT